MKTLLLGVLSLCLMCVSAEAGRAQRREIKQDARITQGIQSGTLTKKEMKKLKKGEKKIDNMQANAAADGVVTPEEKLKIEKAQDRESKAIYRQKHDGQNRKTPDATSPIAPVPAPAENN